MFSSATTLLLSTVLLAAGEPPLPRIVEKPKCVVVYPNDLPLYYVAGGKGNDEEIVDAYKEYAAYYRAGWDACWCEFEESQAHQRPKTGWYTIDGGYFSSDLEIPFAQCNGYQGSARSIGYSRCAEAISLSLTTTGRRSRPLRFIPPVDFPGRIVIFEEEEEAIGILPVVEEAAK